MTLIAVTTHATHAEIVTDDASYTVNGSQFGRCTKTVLLTHLDAAMVAQGDGEFGLNAKAVLLRMSEFVTDYDDLTDHASEWLSQVWENEPGTCDSTVVLVGYSAVTEQFSAYAYASERDFAQVPALGLWAMPMPWNLRATMLEVERMQGNPHITDKGKHETAEMWLSRPEAPVPTTLDEWVRFAETVREHRALETFNKVFVAGNVNHTRIQRGAATTQRIHTFNDTGDEFNQLVANTHHPQAQVGPCHCGSGERFIDCHLAPHLDEPCGCGSGTAMRECCSVATA